VNPRGSRFFAAAVLGGHLLIVATQSPDPTGGASNLLAAGALRFVAPLAALIDLTASSFDGLAAAVRTRRTLERENRALREEVIELRRARLRWLGLEREVGELWSISTAARGCGR
jgi:hypothetical protein